MARVTFDVVFTDGSRKTYTRSFPNRLELEYIREFPLTRPYLRTPRFVDFGGKLFTPRMRADIPATEAEPARKARTKAEAPKVKAPKPKAEPKAPKAEPAPKARVTQTRAEKAASAATRKAADTKNPKLSAHERRMQESPAYAKVYLQNVATRGHVASTMRAYKAMVAEFEKSTRKSARKSA